MYNQSIVTIDGAPTAKERFHGPSNLLIPLRLEGSKRPFFCVHPIGGGADCFQSLAWEMDRERPFYGLQSPMLKDPTARPESIQAMASLYIAAIRTIQHEGPYLLGGWSFGGAVAMEMVRQLPASGETVEELVLLDVLAAPPRRLDVARFAEQLGVDMRYFGVCEAHMTLWRAHQSAALSVPATHFIAAGGEGHGFAIRASRKMLPIQGIETVDVPGDHNSMHSGENAASLAAKIDAVLAAAEWRMGTSLAAA